MSESPTEAKLQEIIDYESNHLSSWDDIYWDTHSISLDGQWILLQGTNASYKRSRSIDETLGFAHVPSWIPGSVTYYEYQAFHHPCGALIMITHRWVKGDLVELRWGVQSWLVDLRNHPQEEIKGLLVTNTPLPTVLSDLVHLYYGLSVSDVIEQAVPEDEFDSSECPKCSKELSTLEHDQN